MSKYIVGLDIGTTKIACFIGERSQDDKIRIVGFGKTKSAGVEHGVVKNIIDAANSIQKAVDEASQMAKYEVEEVYVGVAGQHISSRTNRGSLMIPNDHPLIEQSDLDRLIEDQYRLVLEPGEEIIHVFPQCYEVDKEQLGIEINPVGVAGKCLEADFHIVTGNVTAIRHIRNAVVKAGYKVKGLVLEPVASSLAVLDDRDRDAGVALVDIGGGTTDIAIFHEGIIRHTSVLALAGQAITEDVRRLCGIAPAQAESLKVKFGSCLPSCVNQDEIVSIPGIRGQQSREISLRSLAGIIKNRVQLILEQVDYEIEKSHYPKQSLLAGIVLTGGGGNIKNIKDFSELIIGVDSRIGTPDEHIDKDNSISFENLNHPMYATGVGLIIYGLAEEERLAMTAAENQAEDEVVEPEVEAAPIPDPEPAPEESETKEKRKWGRKKRSSEDEPKSKKKGFFDVLNSFGGGVYQDFLKKLNDD